mgnify:CR=1 FL=1
MGVGRGTGGGGQGEARAGDQVRVRITAGIQPKAHLVIVIASPCR